MKDLRRVETRGSALLSESFESILVISTGQIGDALLTTPLIRAARECWPQARIDVLGFQGTLAMLHGNVDVNRLIEVPKGSGWLASVPLLRTLWRRYDLALITDASDRAHLYAWFAARRRSGLLPRRTSAAWWKRLLLSHSVLGDAQRHIVDEKLALLAPWQDATAAPASAPAVVPPQAAALAREVESALRPVFVVVQVPSMWRYKQWPLAHYRSLVAALTADGVQVLLTGGPGEDDLAKVAEVASVADMADVSDAPLLLNLAGQVDFGQLATLLRRAALYIGPDTSVTHLAAACGANVIAVFGPTPPVRWGPRAAAPDAAGNYANRAARQQIGRVIMLQGANACVPCGRAGCDDHRDSRSLCLEALSPERVLAEARALLVARRNVAADERAAPERVVDDASLETPQQPN